jgi:diguanylate cyclase (GGDEF)-like protein
MRDIRRVAQSVAKELGLTSGEISRRIQFLEVESEDRELLQAFLGQGGLDDLSFIDVFYDYLATFEELKPFISDTEQLSRLKETQKEYFRSLFRADYDDDYVLHRLQVGLAHEWIGLDPKWYMGAYSKFIQLILPRILERVSNRNTALNTCQALLKVLFFDMTLTLDSYFYEGEKLLREKRELLDRVPAIVFMCDPKSLKMVHLNRAGTEQCFQGRELAGNVTLDEVFPGYERHTAFGDIERLKIEKDSIVKRRLGCARAGEAFLCEMSLSLTEISGLPMLVGTVADITEQEKREQEISYQAEYDVATGLLNRYKLLSDLDALSLDEGQVSLIFLEIDHFDVINATLGYEVGDNVLVMVARLLKCFSAAKIKAYWIRGGSFVINCCGIDDKELKELVAEVHLLLDERVEFEGYSLSLDVRSGIAQSPVGKPWNGDTLIRQAKQALAKAKKEFKASLYYSAEMESFHKDHILMTTELRRAIEEDRLMLYYQPKIDMKRGCVVGVESLVRWNEPGRGMVPPDEFVPLAEKSGVMHLMTEWVMKKALDQLALWCAKYPEHPIYVSVNLATGDIENDLLMDRLKGELSSREIDPSRLILEVTETGLVHDPDKVIQRLHEMNALGTQQSLDDFGAGYSSLSYLRDLPVQELKMDRSFSKNIVRDKKSRAIVDAAIQVAHTLDMKVVAEGVEDRAMWDVLSGLGCDVAQGYFMGMPMPVDEFEVWLDESEWGFGKRAGLI